MVGLLNTMDKGAVRTEERVVFRHSKMVALSRLKQFRKIPGARFRDEKLCSCAGWRFNCGGAVITANTVHKYIHALYELF